MGFGKGHGLGAGRGRGYGYGKGLGRGKGGGAGYSWVKYIFFTFNVLFWLLGCAILGTGIWLQVSKGSYASLSSSFNFLSATVVCIIVGVFILLIGFFGCCGAIMENRCLLVTYFILVSVIFVMEIVAAALMFTYQGDIEEVIGEELKNGISQKFSQEGDEEGFKAAWSLVQSQMKCCGVYNYSDWLEVHSDKLHGLERVPLECCENSTCLEKPRDFFQRGCLPEMKERLAENLYIVGIIIICITVFQILGLVASMLLACMKREKYYDE